jgi:hypothetical protein
VDLVFQIADTADLPDVSWRRASASNPYGNCVEIAALTEGRVAVRHSRSPAGPALIYSNAELAAFIDGVRCGEFDDLVVNGH